MNSLVSIIIKSSLCLSLIGGALPPAEPIEAAAVKAPVSSSVSMGITVNKIKFETITDFKTLPTTMLGKIEEIKARKGFFLFENKEYGINEDGYHIFVGLGEKNTGGYAIKVNAVEDNEGITYVYVEEITPGEGSITPQVVTYPYVLIKVKGVTPNVKIVSGDGSVYENLAVTKDNVSIKDWLLFMKKFAKMIEKPMYAIYGGQNKSGSIRLEIDGLPVDLQLSPDMEDRFKSSKFNIGDKVQIRLKLGNRGKIYIKSIRPIEKN